MNSLLFFSLHSKIFLIFLKFYGPSGLITNMKYLGFTGRFSELIKHDDYAGYDLARVIVEHKERYTVQSDSGIYIAEITGNLRYTAKSRLDFPAVGDWVKITMMDAENAIILSIFPRFSMLERQAIGKFGEIQVIASNIDYAFIVQSVGHDYNLNRFERYLAICYSANIQPILILSKTDLINNEEIKLHLKEINDRIPGVLLLPYSIENEAGFKALNDTMEAYKTYCFIGSSGVGKSTIVNRLMGREVLRTEAISEHTNKGRHTTSHRELIILPNESIVIDTPGMREIGMTDNPEGIDRTYESIAELSKTCKFSDCTHIHEKGCSVLKALDEGEITENTYNNYQKLKREQIHFSSTVHEKRQKDKEFGKIIKAVLKEQSKNK